MSDPDTPKIYCTNSPLGHDLVLENIVAAIADGVMVISQEGVISLVNPALCQILGLSASDMLNKGWVELFIEQGDNLQFSQTVVRVIQSGEVLHNTQVPYTTPGGQEKALIATTSLIRDESQKLLGVVAVFKDITELKELNRRERELLAESRRLFEERQDSLDRIARALAHEIRNPVTALGGLAARLLKKADPKSRESMYYQNMLQAAAELEQIVTEVHKYADIELEALVPTDLGQWLSGLLVPYQTRGEAQKVNISQRLQPGLNLKLDRELLGLALCNLLDNALEAMPKGGELLVALAKDDRHAVITISDTGCGIPQEEIPYLFDPFYTSKADRVGMSLAIANRVIGEHHGGLAITSQVDQGTVCSITLPLDGR